MFAVLSAGFLRGDWSIDSIYVCLDSLFCSIVLIERFREELLIFFLIFKEFYLNGTKKNKKFKKVLLIWQIFSHETTNKM